MISSVSFRSTMPASNFQDVISRPQAYTVKDAPQASSPINGQKSQKSSVLKTIAKAVGVVAVTAGALALIAKTGVLKQGKNQTLNSIKSVINNIGNAILDTASSVKNKILPKAAEVVEDAAGAASDIAG